MSQTQETTEAQEIPKKQAKKLLHGYNRIMEERYLWANEVAKWLEYMTSPLGKQHQHAFGIVHVGKRTTVKRIEAEFIPREGGTVATRFVYEISYGKNSKDTITLFKEDDDYPHPEGMVEHLMHILDKE